MGPFELPTDGRPLPLRPVGLRCCVFGEAPGANVIPPAAADATAAEAIAALVAAVAAAAAVATLAIADAVPAAAAEATDDGAGAGTEKEGGSAKGVAPELNAGGRDRIGRSADAGVASASASAAAVAAAAAAAATADADAAAAAAAAGDEPRLNRPVVADNGVGLTKPVDGVDLNENAGTGGQLSLIHI